MVTKLRVLRHKKAALILGNLKSDPGIFLNAARKTLPRRVYSNVVPENGLTWSPGLQITLALPTVIRQRRTLIHLQSQSARPNRAPL